MVIGIFPVSSAQILKPINNTAMSLTSIQKNINSLPTNMDLHLRPHTSRILIFRVSILHVFMHEALAETNKMVTCTSHVFAMKILHHTAQWDDKSLFWDDLLLFWHVLRPLLSTLYSQVIHMHGAPIWRRILTAWFVPKYRLKSSQSIKYKTYHFAKYSDISRYLMLGSKIKYMFPLCVCVCV